MGAGSRYFLNTASVMFTRHTHCSVQKKEKNITSYESEENQSTSITHFHISPRTEPFPLPILTSTVDSRILQTSAVYPNAASSKGARLNTGPPHSVFEFGVFLDCLVSPSTLWHRSERTVTKAPSGPRGSCILFKPYHERLPFFFLIFLLVLFLFCFLN